VATGCEANTLRAIDELVGRPNTWVITGAVTPMALPIDVPATAVVAAMSKRDRRVIGDLAQDLNKYVESLFM
jgi:hypothetical protein